MNNVKIVNLYFKGYTIDSVFPLQSFEHNKLKHDYIRRVQDELGPIKLIIIDEISMIGADKLGTVDQICRLATLKISEII